jgi:hypothetical protein
MGQAARGAAWPYICLPAAGTPARWESRFIGGSPMSRMININATEDHVLATCTKRNIAVSAIETLQTGGTRVVMNNAADAALVAKAYGSKVITGPVTRTPMRLRQF